MTLAQAKKNLRDAEKLVACRTELGRKTALEIANRILDVASNAIAPDAASHVRKWLNIYRDARTLVQELSK